MLKTLWYLLAGILTVLAMQMAANKANAYEIMNLPRVVEHKKAKKTDAAKPLARVGGQIRIGVIDTGYNPDLLPEDAPRPKLCKTGHTDFSSGRAQARVGFSHPHGTIVAGLIAERLEGLDYCLVIYDVMTFGGITMEALFSAVDHASRDNLLAVNISLEGPRSNYAEKKYLAKLTQRGTVAFIAAGNKGLNIGVNCTSFPSCYKLPNTVIVGALAPNEQYPEPYSNYGQAVNVWYRGDAQYDGQTVNGTSFATPRALADFVFGLSYSVDQ